MPENAASHPVPDEDLAIVQYAAALARQAWTPLWPIYLTIGGGPGPRPGAPASADCCIPSSFALRDVLRALVPEFSWRVVGGRPTKRTPFGGFLSEQGISHPHLWVEGRRRGMKITVDITADQFGAEEVIVEEGVSGRHMANATPGLLNLYETRISPHCEVFFSAFDLAMTCEAASMQPSGSSVPQVGTAC